MEIISTPYAVENLKFLKKNETISKLSFKT